MTTYHTVLGRCMLYVVGHIFSVILYSLQSRPLALSVKLYRARGSAGNINVELGGGRWESWEDVFHLESLRKII